MSPLARMCATRGCTTIIPIAVDRCPDHTSAYNTANNKHDTPAKNKRPHTHIYQDPRWKACRLRVLNRDHWTCTIQLPGCTHTATIADHYPTPVLDCPNPFDDHNCRSACRHCSGTLDGQRSHTGTPRTEQTTGRPQGLLIA